jgi:hypothetical protein
MNKESHSTDTGPLRAEASEVKQCFTNFSFQAISLSLTVLAATFGLTDSFPNAVYAPLPAIGLLMATCRLGVFKYATANRNLGYELHLARTTHIEAHPHISTRWRPEMRQIDWEEAVRAWRVVQPTLFRVIYLTPQTDRLALRLIRWKLGSLNFFHYGLYRFTGKTREVIDAFKKGNSTHNEYPWFLPTVLVKGTPESYSEDSAVYYAGSYLNGMLSTLVATQVLMLVPLGIAFFEVHSLYDLALGVALLAAISSRALRIKRRRIILEDELLSIHSCSIVWEVVVVCHYLAIEKGLEHYTERLAFYATEVSKNAFSIHQWLNCITHDP